MCKLLSSIDTLLVASTVKIIARSRRVLKDLSVTDDVLDGVAVKASWSDFDGKLVAFDYSGYLFLIDQIDTDDPTVYFRRTNERTLSRVEELPEYMGTTLLTYLSDLHVQYSNLEKVYGSLTWMVNKEPGYEDDRLNDLNDSARSILKVAAERMLNYFRG